MAPPQTATKIAIPIALLSGRQWVCFNKDKAPISPITLNGVTGDLVEGNNDWASYEEAVRAWEADKGEWLKGIGREFIKNQCITGIDLDDCIDKQGNLTEWAQYVVTLLNSFTEYSLNEHGLHIWVYGSIPNNLSASERKYDGDKLIEAYDCKRYFTVTGKHFPGTPLTIEHRPEQLAALYQEVRVRRDLAIQTKRGQRQRKSKTEKLYKTSGTTGDTPYGLKALTEDCAELATMAANSGRNDRMNAIAYKMGQYVGGRELTRATAEDRIYSAARQCGLPEREIEKTLYRAIEDGIQSPRSAPAKNTSLSDFQAHSNGNGGNTNGTNEPPPTAKDPYRCGLTDLGNAERFYDRYKDTVRWCETWSTWVVFNGKCWEPDKSGRVDQLAKVVVRAIYYEAAAAKAAGLTEEGEKIWKHAKASESNRAIRALLDRAKSELPITPDEFNTHLHLLNCLNGTLDLRTGELRPHNSHDFLTRCIKLKYNPLAPRPTWVTFFETILSGDFDLIAFMQEALGMSLSGDTSEQCLFICHGNGSNGKTTMLETIRIIMAGYGLAANIETFQVRKGEAIRNDIAELYGARLVTASENTMGSRLNEAFIKKATGKEPLRARRLHENEFEFMPEFTLWLAVNHKPVVKDTTKGMWRRVHFIPFLKTFEEGQVDKHFGEKLLDEAEGILAWLVQGCIAWYSRGQLTIPKAVKDATQAYRAEMDMIGSFLANECDLSNKEQKATTKDLLERYEAWCKQLGETFNPKDLKRGLNERGLHSKRGHGGTYVYSGIRLLPATEDASSGEGMGEGGEGGERKNKVISRDVETCKIISDLPSPTFTTFTPSSSETKLGKCEICKWRDAESLWKGGKAYCNECKEQERQRTVQP